MANAPAAEPTLEVSGVLQVTEAGHGCLRSASNDYNSLQTDPVIPRELIEEMQLETGL